MNYQFAQESMWRVALLFRTQFSRNYHAMYTLCISGAV